MTGFTQPPEIPATPERVPEESNTIRRSKIFKSSSAIGSSLSESEVQQSSSIESLPVRSKESIISKTKTNINFKPLHILLDNWEMFYETIMGINNETALLYRCCSLLVNYPQFCQPFLQLLLNKIETNQDSNTVQIEEHLIPSISSILQEEPNCVGGSWKPFFTKAYINGKV